MTEPPNDTDAERIVLGAAMLSRQALVEAADIISPADLFHPPHILIWATLTDLHGQGHPTDPVALAHALGANLGKVGGAVYLAALTETVPTAAMVGHYARIVADKAEDRRLIELGTRIAKVGHEPTHEPDNPKAARVAEMVSAVLTRERGDGLRPIGDGMDDLLAAVDAGAKKGLSTGLADLDRLTNGMQPGQMWVVGARPSVGKSTLLVDFCRSVALVQGRQVALFSLEMSADGIRRRLLSAESRVPLQAINTGGAWLGSADWSLILEAERRLRVAPMAVAHRSGLTISDLSAQARHFAGRKPLALIAVDYLQLMGGIGGRESSRERDVAGISRGLKILAGDLGAPVVVAAQLNRGPEQRTDKRPLLADLRESGSIEADADVVILLHRDDYYDRESPRAGEADLILAKNRDGATDTVTVAAQLHLARFMDMTTEGK